MVNLAGSTDTLVLVGAPAAGKSTIARLVAERTGAGFVDTDEEVARTLGMPLSEAYASLPGERIAAAQTSASLTALQRPGVVSLGSAAVEQEAVRAALQGLDVVWLQVSVAQATRRLGMAALGMEALTGLRKRMEALLAEREHWYDDVATARVDTDKLDVEATADRVAGLWEEAR